MSEARGRWRLLAFRGGGGGAESRVGSGEMRRMQEELHGAGLMARLIRDSGPDSLWGRRSPGPSVVKRPWKVLLTGGGTYSATRVLAEAMGGCPALSHSPYLLGSLAERLKL